MALRFKLDENLPRRVESALRDLGHDVETAISEGFAGATDLDLLSDFAREDRLLVRLEFHFAYIRDCAFEVSVVSEEADVRTSTLI